MGRTNNNIYTVYKHISPSNKVYIGITRQKPERRWANGHGYKDTLYLSNAIKKYGWENFEHEILCTGLTKKEAEQKEIELIAFYKSNNREFGYNIANGGNGFGMHSDETKKKMSESKMGEKHPKYGQHLSDEYKQRISEKLKGRKRKKESIEKMIETKKGRIYEYKPYSEEHSKKVSDAQKIPICQYSRDGILIKTHDSALNAGIEIGVSASSITACCKNKQKTSGGYIWRYANEELNYEHLQWCNEGKKNFHLKKAVYQYTINNNFVGEYASVKEASLKTGINRAGISACCRGIAKSAGGYIWRYKDNAFNINKAS